VYVGVVILDLARVLVEFHDGRDGRRSSNTVLTGVPRAGCLTVGPHCLTMERPSFRTVGYARGHSYESRKEFSIKDGLYHCGRFDAKAGSGNTCDGYEFAGGTKQAGAKPQPAGILNVQPSHRRLPCTSKPASR
jgi:hypothetical protein